DGCTKRGRSVRRHGEALRRRGHSGPVALREWRLDLVAKRLDAALQFFLRRVASVESDRDEVLVVVPSNACAWVSPLQGLGDLVGSASSCCPGGCLLEPQNVKRHLDTLAVLR